MKFLISIVFLTILCIKAQIQISPENDSLRRELSQYYVPREIEETHKDEIEWSEPLPQYGLHCSPLGFCWMYCSRTKGFTAKWWYWCWSGFDGVHQTCKKDIDCNIPTCAKVCNV